ncbi:hypothetical protein ONE63_011096 [Megalurothrips usitatus]|uniref:DUF7869 domain-containing protein n=1 Tax=Megalurothrips usitatus TaxID=439358 RepID=A0AAV7XLK7_9NEOP|nr:hypothetical protein ONE63_011096 [Megalurothrips usitatus]
MQDPLDEVDLEDHSEEPKPPTKRKLKSDRKIARNSGQLYSTASGEEVPARSAGEVHKCGYLKCHTLLSPEEVQQLFSEFWSLGSHNRQWQKVASLIEYKEPARRRKRMEDSGKSRRLTYFYHFEVNGKRLRVCKETFLSVLCVSETFVRNAMEKKLKTVSGIPEDDARGKHEPKNKLSPDTVQAVKAHISSFPSYVSHYCRAQTKSLYFAADLDKKTMYDLYIQQGNPKVSFTTYKQHVKDSGRKFKKWKSDHCGKCDKLNMEIKACGDQEKVKSLQAALELHLRKADRAYELKKETKMLALKDDTIRVLVYDLEKCLPVPFLRTGDSYYTRQINMFNLTVLDTSSNLTYCYMWPETEASRGANSIASCLLRHILQQVPNGVKKVFLFSDACTSQNRNSHVSAMYFVALQQHPSIEQIDHIFMVSGHSFLEVDNKHSVIERRKDKLERISVPEQWYDFVREAGKTADSTRYPDEFYDFANLLKTVLIKREKTLSGAAFNWLNTFWFKYTLENLGIIEVKNSHNADAGFEKLSFLRQGVKSSFLPNLSSHLVKCFSGPQPISVQKQKDLLKLLPFLETKYHSFYLNLRTEKSLEDTDPDLPEDLPPQF